MAVVICSRTWAENHQRARGVKLWNWLVRKSSYPVEVASFRIYLAAAHKTVFRTLNPKSEDDVRADDICADAAGYEPLHKLRGRSLGAPLIARLLQFVTSGDMFKAYGYATPYDFPYAAALNFYLAHLEAEGCARIEGDAEADAKRQWAADVEWAKAEEAKRDMAVPPSTKDNKPSTGLATPPPNLEENG